MEHFETVDCVICGATDLDQITEQGQFGFPTHVCICKNCGLSFLSPRWNADTYQDFYINQYDKYYRSHPKTKPPEKDPTSYFPILKRMESNFGNDKELNKVLDVGSGDGNLLNLFMQKDKGSSFYAIEPSASHEKKLTAKGIHFISNDVNTDWDKNFQNQFDFIIMRHVLEHFLNPLEVLEKLKNVLSKEGLIYVAVPNALKPVFPLKDFFFRVVHTFYFNKKSLTNLLHKAGYEVISMEEGDSYHPDELFVFAKRSASPIPVITTGDDYRLQKEVFEERVRKEKLLPYKIKSQSKKLIGVITRIKKSIFPKPLFKN